IATSGRKRWRGTARKAASTAAARTWPAAFRPSTRRSRRPVGLAFALALAGDGFLRWLLGLLRLLRLRLALLLDRRELHLVLLEALRHLDDQQIHDLPHLGRREGLEDDHGIDAVQEFGAEGLLQL